MIGGASGNTPIPLPPDVTRGRSGVPDSNARPQPAPDNANARDGTRRGDEVADPQRPRRTNPSGETETVRLRSQDQSGLSRRSQQALATFQQVEASDDPDDNEGGELLGVDVRV